MNKILSLITLLLLSVATFAEDFNIVGTWNQYEGDQEGLDGVWTFNADETGTIVEYHKGQPEDPSSFTYSFDAANSILTVYTKDKDKGKTKMWVMPLVIISPTEFTYTEEGDVLRWVKQGSDPSGIQRVSIGNSTTGPVYTLSGQRLAAPHKGVNIINGKKVVNLTKGD